MLDCFALAISTYRNTQAPALDEARRTVADCAEAAAKMLLSDRGLVFTKATTPSEAMLLVSHLNAPSSKLSGDVVGHAACTMQVAHLIPPFLRGDSVPKLLLEMGNACFYENAVGVEVPHQYDRQVYAALCFQLIVGLDANCAAAYNDLISVCWQGTIGDPGDRMKFALPYAVVLAHLDPGRDEVATILANLKDLSADSG